MFVIKETTSLTQWDQGILLLNDEMQSGDTVRFVNEYGMSGTMTAYLLNGEVVVEIPNRLLQFDAALTACIAYTDERTVFEVASADKPSDHEFVNNELHSDGIEFDFTIEELNEINAALGIKGVKRLATFIKNIAYKVGLIADFIVEDDIDGYWHYKKYASGHFEAVCRIGIGIGAGTAFLGGYYHKAEDIETPSFMKDGHIVSCVKGDAVLAAFVGGGFSADFTTVYTYWLNAAAGALSENQFGRINLEIHGTWK